MVSNKFRTALSVLCLGSFCLLAAGSMDSSNDTSAPSTNSTASSAPSAESEKQAVLSAAKLKYTWSTDGMIMTGNFKIENPTDHDFKDFEITCNHFAPSGTKIDSNTRTIYEVIKAHGKKTMNDFNMGFIHSQAKSSSCSITDLTLLN